MALGQEHWEAEYDLDIRSRFAAKFPSDPWCLIT
jgi:hypothetical protein